jgi:sec-independent protein translocase protein TatB
MFGIGFFELVIIAIVALIFVGPKKLPEFMKTAGKFFVQVRRTAGDVRSTFDQVVREAEDELRREEVKELQKALLAATHPAPPKEAVAAADDLHNSDGTLKSMTPPALEPPTPEGAKSYQPAAPAAAPPTTEAQWTDKTPPPGST